MIDLTEAEVRMVRRFCLLRPMKAAAEMLVSDWTDSDFTVQDRGDIAKDLEDSGPVFENIRHKLVNALAVAAEASPG